MFSKRLFLDIYYLRYCFDLKLINSKFNLICFFFLIFYRKSFFRREENEI